MTRWIFPLLATLLMAIANPAAAAGDETLTSLRQQQAAVYAIVREFHMQTLLAGDPVRNTQLKAAVEKSRADMQALPAKTGTAAVDAAIAEARAVSQRFTKLALANNITADGYTDDNLVGELYVEAEALSTALGKAIAATPATGKQRARADGAHATNLLVQRTVSSYLKRGAQMSPDVGSEDSFDVGAATQNIDKQIKSLASDMGTHEVMRNVSTKWRFIRSSLVNYNEKTVPFIVDRYASQMNDGLLQVVAELDKK